MWKRGRERWRRWRSRKDVQETVPDPLGVKVVYRPPGERKADIVFVHGLGGNSRATWCKNKDPKLFWPLKFLPLEPGLGDVRILTFGYNAHFQPGSGNNKKSISDFSEELLDGMKHGQDDTAEEDEALGFGAKPIIFVVHSMGGLVVKEAYILGQNNPAYGHIIRAVSAIIFLSTPHRGTNLAETLNRILQVSFVASPTQFISDLASNSHALERLNEHFRHVAPKLDIFSFYETRPTSMITAVKKARVMVLEKDSSRLGYPGEISCPLDADHHEVCKYESREDPSYIRVRNALVALISNIKAKGTDNTETIDPVMSSPAAVLASFEQNLSVLESPEMDYNYFRDRWTSGTCSWILDHAAFTNWVEDSHSSPRILWVHGNAACGKSVLTSFIISHLAQRALPCSYFFIRFTNPKKRSLSMVLGSLACQIARSVPAYADKLRNLETASTNLNTADAWTIWQSLYKKVLFQLNISRRIFLVIDGVDEAENPGSLVRLLADLHLAQLPLRILLVGRKTHEISSALRKLAKQLHMETIQAKANPEDIRLYIDSEMDIAIEGSYRDEVIEQLLQRAQGNVLWVHLVVQKINTCYTKLAIGDALRDLPSGMSGLYDRMASTVNSQFNASDRQFGLSILGWVTCSRRILTLGELDDALEQDGLLDIRRTIGQLCGGLVVTDVEDKVSLIHETAREYLTREGQAVQLVLIEPVATNNSLFLRCIRCLTDKGLRSRISRNQPLALLNYAMKTWFVHFSLGSVSQTDILDAAIKLLQSPHVLTWIYAVAVDKELCVLVLASQYLNDVALKLRGLDDKTVSIVNKIDSLERWATDLTKIVGKFGRHLVQRPDSIFRLIPPFCPTSSIIYQQFGRKEARSLSISGFGNSIWDDCLARLSLDKGMVGSVVLSAPSHIVILANIENGGCIIFYDAVTFEELRRLSHPEQILGIEINTAGDLLISYGDRTTRVWDATSGECVKVMTNPPKLPTPQTLVFSEDSRRVFFGSEDHCVWSFSLADKDSTEWGLHSSVEEESLDGITVQFPICSALSPDGNMIAYGYSDHLATAWELEPPMPLGQCNILSKTDMTAQESTCGKVYKLAWHPVNVEVFGLTQAGLLFKWDPYDVDASVKFNAGASSLTISKDGSLVATGDGVGTLKVFLSSDLTLVYQLSKPDPVTYLSFSADSRCLYDIRGSYGNVWILDPSIWLAKESECPKHNSNTSSELGSRTKISLRANDNALRVNGVVSLSCQPGNSPCSHGIENGVAALCEVAEE